MKKKITAGILLLLLLAGGCAQPAYANSAQRHWSGTDVTGAVVTGEDCPIVVERELLTFDVQEFPEQYYPDTDSFLAYTGKVTAEYTFRNPADYTVTATLVFPFGDPPHYGEYIYDQAAGRPFDVSDALKYGVTLDGKPIEAAVRHTLKTRHTSFSLDEDLPKLADSYICDSFFVPDMPVRVQRYSVTGIDEEYGAATAAFVINADSAKTRVLCEKQTGGARLKKGSQASCWVQNGDTITVYIFGELPKEELIWTLYENGACEKVIEGTVSSEFSEMTFKDYALRGYDENSGILESDWYNAQVELLRLGSEIWGNGLVQIEAGVFSLMRWYEYTITLEPGQTLKNAVTAPLYPAIDADYTPSIYAYTYLLSPAKTWTQFGKLDITVNTPYYMTECGIDGFTRTDGGYALTLPGLPEGELTFTLSEAERPQPPKRSILHLMPTELIIVPAAVLVAAAAVFLPARRKRRTKR